MNPFLQQVIIQTAKQKHSSDKRPNKKVTSYDMARAFYQLKVTAKRIAKDALLIIVGIVAAGFGLEGFLLPNSFIDGGVTGISLLTAELTKFPLPILILVINIPFVILAYTQLGKQFALKSILAIIGLALAITFIHYPVVTSDKLLISVFGGFFLGIGIVWR
jgi:uncharacterized membrane-anchored protein YitT (DUF2179 family)